MDIFRQSFCNLSRDKSANFLQAVALCDASIKSSFVVRTPDNKKTLCFYTMYFVLKFKNQQDLDKFHLMGFCTNECDKPHVN